VIVASWLLCAAEETERSIERIRGLTSKPFGIGCTLMMVGASGRRRRGAMMVVMSWLLSTSRTRLGGSEWEPSDDRSLWPSAIQSTNALLYAAIRVVSRQRFSADPGVWWCVCAVVVVQPGAKENAEVALRCQVPVINYSLGKGDWLAKGAHAYGGKVRCARHSHGHRRPSHAVRLRILDWRR
jgi:hypothetical protein